jgi:hypothetical protein
MKWRLIQDCVTQTDGFSDRLMSKTKRSSRLLASQHGQRFGGCKTAALMLRVKNSLFPDENSLFPKIYSLLIWIGNCRNVAAAQCFLAADMAVGEQKRRNSL